MKLRIPIISGSLSFPIALEDWLHCKSCYCCIEFWLNEKPSFHCWSLKRGHFMKIANVRNCFQEWASKNDHATFIMNCFILIWKGKKIWEGKNDWRMKIAPTHPPNPTRTTSSLGCLITSFFGSIRWAVGKQSELLELGLATNKTERWLPVLLQ